MTKTKRTAAEIRAYLAHNEDTDMPLHDYVAMLEEDVLRLLDAAEYGRLALKRILVYADDPEIVRSWATNALAETAWLELSPEPALSPDGENEDGEDE